MKHARRFAWLIMLIADAGLLAWGATSLKDSLFAQQCERRDSAITCGIFPVRSGMAP